MFCNLFWNPDCPFFSPLSGNPLKFDDLLQFNSSPRDRANRTSSEKSCRRCMRPEAEFLQQWRARDLN